MGDKSWAYNRIIRFFKFWNIISNAASNKYIAILSDDELIPKPAAKRSSAGEDAHAGDSRGGAAARSPVFNNAFTHA